jgi:hypothetical protein
MQIEEGPNMKTSNRKYQFAMWMGACLLLGSTASGQFTPPTVPNECKDSRNSKGWTSSRASGESRVNSVWKSAAVGQNLDNLSDRLPVLLDGLEQTMISLAGGQDVTQYVRCRAQGYVDGFIYRLNQLFGQCVLDGADWGQFAANLYCSLSLELGGLGDQTLLIRAPVGLCGNLFEVTCEDLYRYVGLEGDYSIQPTVASYLQVSGFTPEPFQGCAEFAEDTFLSVFEQSLHNDCSYEIEE